MSKDLNKEKKHMVNVNPTPTTSNRTEMFPLFTDTTFGTESGSSQWESMYKLFEERAISDYFIASVIYEW